MFFVGNAIVDTLLKHREKVMQSSVIQALGLNLDLVNLQRNAHPSKAKNISQAVWQYGV